MLLAGIVWGRLPAAVYPSYEAAPCEFIYAANPLECMGWVAAVSSSSLL
jgi:hypothetical protein